MQWLCFYFCSLQDAVAADFTSLTKTLYDLHKAQDPAKYNGSPLVQLVVENFDEEQIWQQLELQNSAVLTHFTNAVDEAVSDVMLAVLEEEEEMDEETGDEEEEPDENMEEEVEEKPRSRFKKMADREAEDYTDEDSDLDFDVDALEKREKQKREPTEKHSKMKGIPSEVDDNFFKLSEMESFLDGMDKKEGKENADDEDNDVDYFQDLPSDEEDNFNLEMMSSRKPKENTVRIVSSLHYDLGSHEILNVLIMLYINRRRARETSSTRTILVLLKALPLMLASSWTVRMTVRMRRKMERKK